MFSPFHLSFQCLEQCLAWSVLNHQFPPPGDTSIMKTVFGVEAPSISITTSKLPKGPRHPGRIRVTGRITSILEPNGLNQEPLVPVRQSSSNTAQLQLGVTSLFQSSYRPLIGSELHPIFSELQENYVPIQKDHSLLFINSIPDQTLSSLLPPQEAQALHPKAYIFSPSLCQDQGQ